MFLQPWFQTNYIFSIKPKIFNILIDYFPLNSFSLLFLHLLQITERTKKFFYKYDILDFLNFLHLLRITQDNFFIFLVIENILVLFYDFIIILIIIRRI